MPRPGPIVLALLVLAAPCPAQDSARARAEKEAAAQAAQADKLFKAGQYGSALKLYRAEAATRKRLGDPRYEAYALRGMGCCLVGLGDDEAAIDAFWRAREVDAGREDRGFEGYDGLLIGQAQLRLGKPEDAATALDHAVPALGQAVDRDHECDARLALVTARLATGEPEKATAHASRAVALAEEIGDPRRLADAWRADALADRALGRLGPALERMLDARDAYEEQERTSDQALATRVLADLCYRLGRRDRAARRFAEAAALHARIDDRLSEADDRLDLATVRLDRGELDVAAREADLARRAFFDGGDDASSIRASVLLSQAQARAKDGLDAASKTIRAILPMSARVHRDAPAERIRLLLLSAELESRLGRASEAKARVDDAQAVAFRSADDALLDAVAKARARLLTKAPAAPPTQP